MPACGGCLSAHRRARGPTARSCMRSTEALQPYPARLADRLEHWAREAPDRSFVAKRGKDGEWRRITYAQMLDRAQRVGQALTQRGLSVERPIAILSENDLEHLTLALAAMWVGIPYTPVSPAYSLVSHRPRQAAAHLRDDHARPGVRERPGLCARHRGRGRARRRGGADRRRDWKAARPRRSPHCSAPSRARKPPPRMPRPAPTRSSSSSSPPARPRTRRAWSTPTA